MRIILPYRLGAGDAVEDRLQQIVYVDAVSIRSVEDGAYRYVTLEAVGSAASSVGDDVFCIYCSNWRVEAPTSPASARLCYRFALDPERAKFMVKRASGDHELACTVQV